MKISLILAAAAAAVGFSGSAVAQDGDGHRVTIVKKTTVVREHARPAPVVEQRVVQHRTVRHRVVKHRVVRHRVVRHRVVHHRVVHHPVVHHDVVRNDVRATVRQPHDSVRTKVVVKTRTVTH